MEKRRVGDGEILFANPDGDLIVQNAVGAGCDDAEEDDFEFVH